MLPPPTRGVNNTLLTSQHYKGQQSRKSYLKGVCLGAGNEVVGVLCVAVLLVLLHHIAACHGVERELQSAIDRLKFIVPIRTFPLTKHEIGSATDKRRVIVYIRGSELPSATVNCSHCQHQE